MSARGLSHLVTAWLIATLVGLMGPTAALAQSAVQAHFLDDAARAAYARGDYEAALADFFELARLSPSQSTLYNVAICAQLARRDALAYDALDRYLLGPADDPRRMEDARERMRALSARVALVHVTSSHPDATIWVDRRELGAAGTTPDTVVVSPGAHVIEVTHPAAHDARVEIVAETGVVRTIHLELTPRLGRLRVSSDGAAGLEIEAVSEASGTRYALAPDAETSLPIGSYRVTLRAPGRVRETLIVQIREGVLESRVATLRALPRPTGFIVIRSDVRGRVRVDGVERSETPARIPTEVGTHRVEIVAPGHRTWTGEVEVHDGGASYVNVSLVRED